MNLSLRSLSLVVAAVGVFSFSTVLGGCAAHTSDENDDSASADSDITGSALSGTYENPTDENDDMPFYAITFSTDHTYKATGGCRQDGPGVHCFAITELSGTWKSHKSGPQLGAPAGAPQIVLTDDSSNENAYFFTLVSGKLSLSETFGGTASIFEKAVPAPVGPSGTYSAGTSDSLPFYTVTFSDDGTFSATGGCRPAKPGGFSCFAITHISGSWSTAMSGPQLGSPEGAPQLVLVDSFDQTSKYFYTLSSTGKTLSLSETWGGEASTFKTY